MTSLSYVTITGQFTGGSNTPLSGTVTFTASQAVYAAGVPVATPSVPIVAQVIAGQLLSESGGPLRLLATDNDGVTFLTLTGFFWWQVEAVIGGVTQAPWSFGLPSSPSTVDLFSLANTPFSGGGGGSSPPAVITSSGPFTGPESTILLSAPSLTVSMPDAAASPGRTITAKLDSPFTTGTITTVDGQLIDGYPSYQMGAQYQWCTLQSDGTNWQVIGAKPGGLLTIPVPALPAGTANVPYSAQLTATGGWPGYTWSVKSGALPDGVSLSTSGAISGTPTVATTSSFTVQVTDSIGSIATAALAITVGGGIVIVQPGALVNASNGASAAPVFLNPTTAGNLLIAHVGGNGSGAITTTAPGWVVAGTAGHAIAYKEDCGAAETPPVFTRASTSDMWAYLEEWTGAAASGAADQSVSSSAGSSSWTAAFTNLSTVPGELLAVAAYWNGSNVGGSVSLSSFLDNTGGTITGTFLQGGNAFGQYFAGVSGISGPTGSTHNQAGMTLSVFAGGDGTMVSFKPAAVGPPGNPVVTTASPLPTGSTLQPYTAVLAAEDGVPPYAWALNSGSGPLPAGLTLSADGVISGSPTASGSFPVTVRVTDSISDFGTAPLTLPVALTPTPTFVTSAFTEATGSRSQPYPGVAGITGPTQDPTVNNNVWSPVTGTASELFVVDPTRFWVVANMPPGNTQVLAFQSNDLRFGELPLSSFTKVVSSFSEVMNPTPGTQAWAAYDIWLNNWNNEIMIHHDLARFNPYDSTPLARAIPFGGSNGVPVLAWDLHLYGTSEYVWQPANNAFNIQSGSVDILQMLQWMIDNAFLPAVNTFTAVGYGWEMCSTGGLDEFFQVTAFTLTAEYG